MILKPVLNAFTQADTLVQTIGNSFTEGAAEHFTIALASPDFVDQVVEGVLRAVVGADHMDFTAPDQQSHGRFQQLGQVRMERGFVDHDNALTAAQVGRATGQRNDAVATGKRDGVGFDVFVGVAIGPNAFFYLLGRVVVGPRPHGAGLDILHGHVLVVAQVIDSLTARRFFGRGYQDVVCSFGPGETDTPGFLANLEWGAYTDPLFLIIK